MAALDIETLLTPLGTEAPCGENLEYDPVFQLLLEAAAGKPERQFGDKVYPAEPPDWRAVHEHARALAQRTRDLRVAVWLVRSAARLDGLAAAVDGLRLLHGLVDRHWDHVHPRVDPNDGNDPTERIGAVLPLAHEDGLADLRSAAIGRERGSPTVRQLELAFGNAEPLPKEPAPTADGIGPAVAAAIGRTPLLGTAMLDGLVAATAIANAFDERLASHAPNLAPLVTLLGAVSRAAGGADAPGAEAPDAPPRAASTGAAGTAPSGAIGSREDAIRALQRVVEWIERNEPSNPAPLFIQRAQRLMTKSFIEIIRDLMPDGIGQIEKLAGSVHE
jgi:type VI secretion system protein ImpA